jgi:hypothetical protein
VGFLQLITREYTEVSSKLCNLLIEEVEAYIKRQEGRFIAFGDVLYSSPIKFKTPPSLNEDDFNKKTPFDAADVFNIDERRKNPTIIPHRGKTYQVVYIPILYVSKQELPDTIDLKGFVSLNTAFNGNTYLLRVGKCRNRPRLAMHSFLLEMMDNIVTFHSNDEDFKIQFVLPFHTLEHFAASKTDIDVAMEQYHAWYSTFRTFHDLLLALAKPFKIVIGLAKWISIPPTINELKSHLYANSIGISYQDPEQDITDKKKQESDRVGIDTVTDDEVGDIITVVSWYKGGNTQGKEIIYHISPEAHESIDSLEKVLISNDVDVERREHFFDEMDNMKAIYEKRNNLDLH